MQWSHSSQNSMSEKQARSTKPHQCNHQFILCRVCGILWFLFSSFEQFLPPNWKLLFFVYYVFIICDLLLYNDNWKSSVFPAGFYLLSRSTGRSTLYFVPLRWTILTSRRHTFFSAGRFCWKQASPNKDGVQKTDVYVLVFPLFPEPDEQLGSSHDA